MDHHSFIQLHFSLNLCCNSLCCGVVSLSNLSKNDGEQKMMMIDILSGSVPFLQKSSLQFMAILRNILLPWKIGHCHLMN